MDAVSTKRIKITEKCNQNCIFCDSDLHFSSAVYSRKNIVKLILDRRGAKRLNITGGEPTLCRNLDFYIREARRIGYRQVTILSNANRFAKKDYANKLKKSGLTEVVVSFHHHDAAISDSISLKKGSFVKKIEGIKNLVAADIKVTINIVLYSQNYSLLPEIINYLNSSFGIRFFTFSFLETNCLKVRNSPKLIPDLISAFFFLKKAVKICRTKKFVYYIPFNGAIPPCVFKKYGITINEPEIIAGTDLQAKDYFDFCQKCKDSRFCLGFSKGYKQKSLEILRHAK